MNRYMWTVILVEKTEVHNFCLKHVYVSEPF